MSSLDTAQVAATLWPQLWTVPDQDFDLPADLRAKAKVITPGQPKSAPGAKLGTSPKAVGALGKEVTERKPRRKTLKVVKEGSPSQLLLLKNKGHRGHLLPLTYDHSLMGLLHESVDLPGAVPDHLVPPSSDIHLELPEATDISPEMWVGPAFHSRAAGNSLWIRFKIGSQPPAAYAVMWYVGDSNVSLGITLEEFLAQYADNDYVLASQQNQFGVVGASNCPASYANEGFGTSNAFFWFVPAVKAFFICLRGRAKEGVAYEVLPNYDSPGFPSNYWNDTRKGRLAMESQAACEACYPATAGNQKGCRGVNTAPKQ